MKHEDIIRMAREADLMEQMPAEDDLPAVWMISTPELERFANLVAAAERERIIAANAPEIEKVNVYIKALEDAVAAEREACAKVLDEMAAKDKLTNYYQVAALLIRERGAP